jgi:hypothetical protein
MAYVPEWESLAEALERVMVAGVPRRQAQVDLCRAMADGKIEVMPSFELIKATALDHQMAREYRDEIFKFVHNVRNGAHRYPKPWDLFKVFSVPKVLRPSHLDWRKSRFRCAWSVPLHPEMSPLLWDVSIELCSADVSKALIAPKPALDQKLYSRTTAADCRPAAGTIRDEGIAIAKLAAELRHNPDLTRAEATRLCGEAGLKCSARGMQNRIWPAARQQAGLGPKAPPGRKRKSPR